MTHAPADSTLYRAMMRGQLLHPSGAAHGFDGVGSIRHRSQNFLRRWWVGRDGRNFFKWGWGGGGGWISDKFQLSMSYENVEVPRFQFIDRVVDFSSCAPATCTHSANCAEHRRHFHDWTVRGRLLLGLFGFGLGFLPSARALNTNSTSGSRRSASPSRAERHRDANGEVKRGRKFIFDLKEEQSEFLEERFSDKVRVSEQ